MNEYKDPVLFPGHMGLLDGNGNNTFTAFIYDDGITDTTVFHKRAGSDTIILESSVNEHASLQIRNENDSTGLTTVYMDGLNFADVSFAQIGNHLTVAEGSEGLVVVEDFYLDRTNNAAEGAYTTAFEFEDVVYRRGDDNANTLNLTGETRDARIEGFGGDDIITGGSGNDILVGGAGSDTLNGGSGYDIADYSDAPAGISYAYSISLGQHIVDGGWGGRDVLLGIERVAGSAFDDDFNLLFLRNIDGGDGEDTVRFTTSGMVWDMANDRYFNRSGESSATFENVEHVSASSSANAIAYVPVLTENTVFAPTTSYGLDYSAAGSGITFDLIAAEFDENNGGYVGPRTGHVTGGGFSHDIENSARFVVGSHHGDTYINNWFNHASTFYTGRGDDLFYMPGASVGGMTVYYSGGNDVYQATEMMTAVRLDADIMLSDITNISVLDTGPRNFHAVLTIEGRGTLTIDYNDIWPDSLPVILDTGGQITFHSSSTAYEITGTSTVATTLYGTWGDDTWTARAGNYNQTYYGRGGDDSLHGGNGGDTLSGGDGRDWIYGDEGDDTLAGGLGNDSLFGGIGNDYLYGHEGDDRLTGGSGNDTLTGYDGVDTAIFSGTYANYTVGDYGGGTFYVEDNVGSDGDDWLYTIERLQFANGIYENGVFTPGVPNAAPAAGDDDFYGMQGQVIDGNVLINNGHGRDSDVETEILSVTAGTFATAQGGTVVLNADGSFTYTPVSGFSGTDSFSYTVNDGQGGSDTADVTLVIGAAINGTSSNDVINGTLYGDDVIYGLDGDDIINGRGGNDILDGGAGIDTLSYATAATFVDINLSLTTLQYMANGGADIVLNFENLIGSSYGDFLTGDDNDNVIDGGDGNDVLVGGGGIDTVLYASSSSGVTINLATGIGSDTVSGFENILGSNFNDTLTGDAGANVIDGGDGNDTIDGGAGNDTLIGGLGVDRVTYVNATSSVTVNFSSGVAIGGAGIDALSGFENITGSAFGDTLLGDAGNNSIDGGNGNDFIEGGDGDDTLIGGGGVDTVSYISAAAGVTVSLATTSAQNTGGAGTDTINTFEDLVGSDFDDVLTGNSSANTIEGGFGNDIIIGGAGDDILGGGEGFDIVSYAGASSGVTADLSTGISSGGAGADLFYEFEGLIGSNNGDILTGDDGDNTIDGGNGNDIIRGGLGNDILIGGSGTDTLDYSASISGITVDLNVTTSQNTGGEGWDTISGFEYIIGSNLNDTLIGDGGNNNINGGNGDDLIEGGTGTDVLTGGSGADTVTYVNATAGVTVNLASTSSQNTIGAGSDTLSGFENLAGSSFNDTLTGDANGNVIDGLGGDDTIQGGAGDDTLIGGAGTDRVTYAAASVAVTVNLSTGTASGGAGNDTLSGFENIAGSAFDDTLFGDANSNNIDGGAGNDTIEGGDGNDTLIGGSGTDALSYASASAGITVSLATTSAQNTGGAGTDTISTFENLIGSAYNDILTGSSSANMIDGGAGDDIIQGSTGNDTLIGGSGVDTASYAAAGSAVTVNLATGTASGGAGTDTLSGFENITGSNFNDTLTGDTGYNLINGGSGVDTINGGDGNDTLIGGLGNDNLNGGNGIDTVSYAFATAAVTVNLATGTASGGDGTDSLSNIENVLGSAFNDAVTGSTADNVITTGDGTDTASGGDGNDTLFGGNNDDQLYGDNGADYLQGDWGNDVLWGGAGNDTLYGYDNSGGSPLPPHPSDNDALHGGDGSDVIYGHVGDDELWGDADKDFLYGGANNDILHGGANSDVLEGGAGDDIFVFEAASAFTGYDTITDFNVNDDVIDVSDVLDGFYNPGADPLKYFVEITTNGTDSFVAIDQDGEVNGFNFVHIATLQGVTGLGDDEQALVNSGVLVV